MPLADRGPENPYETRPAPAGALPRTGKSGAKLGPVGRRLGRDDEPIRVFRHGQKAETMSRSREGTRYTDEVLALDVRELARLGAIQPGKVGDLTWQRGDDASGSMAAIRLTVEPGPARMTLVLSYARGRHGTEPVPVRDRFPIEATPCHYGGLRWWVLCRTCGRRVAIVYLAGPDHRFVCRHCGQLAYRSTRLDELDRIDRRRSRLADRLGYPPSWPRDHIPWRSLDRPAGMRPETFARLIDEGILLEFRATILWTDKLRRVLAKADRRCPSNRL